MELLESVGPRPRQARYQAALRPDIRYRLILQHFLDFLSTGLALMVHELCKISAGLNCCAQSSELQVFEKKEVIWTLEPIADGFPCLKSRRSFFYQEFQWAH